jgi:hypothetical protein
MDLIIATERFNHRRTLTQFRLRTYTVPSIPLLGFLCREASMLLDTEHVLS